MTIVYILFGIALAITIIAVYEAGYKRGLEKAINLMQEVAVEVKETFAKIVDSVEQENKRKKND